MSTCICSVLPSSRLTLSLTDLLAKSVRKPTTGQDNAFSEVSRRQMPPLVCCTTSTICVSRLTGIPDGEDSNGISRASSVSAKDKANGNKRKPTKQRRDDSESFDSRSNYVAWCGPQQSTWAPAPQYFPVNSIPFNGQYQQPYPNTIPPPYGPNQAYAQVVPGNAFASQYNGMPTVSCT